jgi:2-haloacid dehalogenase
MPNRPQVVVFDVNETLSDMSVLGQRFADVGADASLAPTWFAGLLRDGLALTVAGSSERFATLAREGLLGILGGVDLDLDVEAAADHVMAGFDGLDVHPDVAEGVRGLAAAGLRLVTLTNGGSAVPEGLLHRAGLREHFEMLLTVEDAGVWKPAPGAYGYAAQRCGVDTAAMLMVAVHPWDIDGAARAGLQTAWVDRTGARYPTYFRGPDRTVTGVDALASELG